MRGIFITGTGTGVGKTYVTGLLLGTLRARGVNAISIKPVQTGCAPGDPPIDLEEHWRLAGWRPDPATAARCAPFVFRDPVSPHLAAQREGRPLDLGRIDEATRAAAAGFDFALVEGAGGVLVPLNDRETMLDLMQRLALPVLVVGEAGVGTINHSVLTIHALRAAQLEVAGLILSAREPVDDALANDNANTIAAMTTVETIGILGQGEGAECPTIRAVVPRLIAS